MENGRTPGILWALALLGVYLYLSQQVAAPASHPVATGHPSSVGQAVVQGFLMALPAVVRAFLWLVTLALVALAAMASLRWWMRVRRAQRMRVDEIILGPDDTATPYEIMSALDAIHGRLLTRYAGSAVGQNQWTFEIVRKADGSVHFLVGAPFDTLEAIEDLWRAKYTNIRFRPWKDTPRPWPLAQQIVLTKHWRHSTETQKDYQNSVVETIVQALDRAQGEVHLQYLLVPLPAEPLHAELRSHIRNMEYQARAQQTADPAAPGVGYAESQVVKDSLQLYGKAVFRTEIRLAADNWDAVQRVFGAIQEAAGENRFRAATVVLGKGLWTRWLYARMPSLLLFGSSVMFSFPLASLIHLPTARLRVNSLQRSLVRRGPAPRAVPRDESLAIVRDETGPVGIPEGDRKYNLLLIGSQGSGKTTDLLNVVKVDSRYRTKDGWGKALVLIDIGKDTAKRALGIVPAEREVIWFDPADPGCPWTVNPMLASVNDDVLADNVLEGLTEVFGDDAIRTRSREFLGNAIMAIRDVMGDEADFSHVYRLLTDEEFRNRVTQSVRDPHQRQYWQVVIPNALANNPRFLEEGLAAPRNKLDEVLRNPRIRSALESGNGRRLIDFADIIRNRKVLVANLDKSKIGEAGARLLGIFLITMLWHALQAQTDVEERDRVPVSLVLDEAQNFISEGFLDILAEGRAYGVQVTVAVRFLGEIASEKVVKGLQALAQNLIVHQFELLEEAETFMKRFMRVFANMITTSDESQDALNFGADDFMRLPKFYSVCRFMVDGTPQPAFLAQTIPWEQAYDEKAKEAHLRAQPRLATAPSVPALPSDLTADLPAPQAEKSEVEPEAEEGETPSEPTMSEFDLLEVLMGEDVVSSLLASARDGLTGLLRRDVWDRMIARAKGGGFTVVFVDLDGLKAVNDGQGHEAGDDLIRRAAEAFRKVLRDTDLAARYGGDEFVVLLRGLTEETFPAFGRRLREAFKGAGVEASIGAAIQRPGESIEEVVRRADAAMYQDKRRRKAGRSSGQAPGKVAEPEPSVAGEGPDRWGENDPRRVLCQRYHLSPQRLLATAQRIGVTDRELREAARWVLEAHVSEGAVMPRLQRVLELKVQDRILKPVVSRLNVDLKTVREALLAVDATPEEAVAVIEGDPSVTTVEQLQSALTARRRARV